MCWQTNEAITITVVLCAGHWSYLHTVDRETVRVHKKESKLTVRRLCLQLNYSLRIIQKEENWGLYFLIELLLCKMVLLEKLLTPPPLIDIFHCHLLYGLSDFLETSA